MTDPGIEGRSRRWSKAAGFDWIGPAVAAALMALPLGLADPNRPRRARRWPRVRGGVLSKAEIRILLRRRGYARIYRLHLDRNAYVIQAFDRFGRHVRLCLNPFTGLPIRRAGFGLAWLDPSAVETWLRQNGYRRVSGVILANGCYTATAADPDGEIRRLRVDALTGAIWH